MSIDSLTGFKAMCGAFTGLTVIAVSLRFVARKKNQLAFQADDWLMLAALTFFIGCMTCMFLLARVGFSGYNGEKGSQEVQVFTEQNLAAYQLLIIWTLGTAKASVLFFYKRVFCQHRDMNPGLRIAIIATLIINAMWVVAFFFLGLFQCGNHFSFGGDHFEYCTLIRQYDEGFYVSDIILDVWIMAMPIPYIIRMKISRWKKWMTVIVFLLSFVGLGASIGRLVNFIQSPPPTPQSVHHAPSGSSTQPRTRSAWTTYIWFGTLEMGTAIVAINLPTLYGLFTQHAPEILLRASRSWSSIASRALGTSDSSSTAGRHHESKEALEVHSHHGESKEERSSYESGAPAAFDTDIEIGRAVSIDYLRQPDAVHVVQVPSGK